MAAILAKYGTAFTFEIPIVKRAVVDFAVSADWTPAAGDVKISKDGGAAANVTNLPTAITMGNGAVWQFALTATEMQAGRIIITVVDAATKAVEDQAIILNTYGNASAMHPFDLGTATVVASSVTGNVAGSVGSVSAAVTVGTNNDKTGYALSNASRDAVAGAAWDQARSSHTTAGSFGEGAASVQGNVTGNVAGSVGSVSAAVTAGTVSDKTGYALSNSGIDAVLDRTIAEPSSVPSWPASIRTALQWLLALSRNKVTQTSATATLRNAADNAAISTAAVSDDGSTFTRAPWQ